MAEYTISKIKLPNNDVCILKDGTAVSKAGDTMTGTLTVPGISVQQPTYPTLYMLDANGVEVASIRGETQSQSRRIVFREKPSSEDEQGGTAYEDYYLPTPTISQGAAGYDVLTTKFAVKVPQGGTGATDAASACNNLGAMKRSIDSIQNVENPEQTILDARIAGLGLQSKIDSIPAYTAVPISMYYDGNSDSIFTHGTTYAGLLYKLEETGGYWTVSLTNNHGEMVLAYRDGSSAYVSFKRVI